MSRPAPKFAVLVAGLILLLAYVYVTRVNESIHSMASPPYLQQQVAWEDGCTHQPRLRFVRYVSSEWEQAWLDNVEGWSASAAALCQRMQSDVKLVKAWSGGAAKSQANGCGHLDASLAREQGVFSRFIFEDQCTGETFTTYIEPLAGLTRHPEALCLDKNADKLGDRGYIVLGQTSETCAHALPSRAAFRAPFARMLVFDLGASTYTTPVGADSQRWFVESYARHGFAVSEYYAWEAGKHDPVAIWAEVPGDLKPHYHWLNIPATPDAESMDNPWNFLRAIATPDDFVAVKLDIDNTPVETAFMEQLFKDPKLQALVDEMFFEHHVNVENMWRYWKTQKEKVYLKDTYSMILQLRQKGIRFHSWP